MTLTKLGAAINHPVVHTVGKCETCSLFCSCNLFQGCQHAGVGRSEAAAGGGEGGEREARKVREIGSKLRLGPTFLLL